MLHERSELFATPAAASPSAGTAAPVLGSSPPSVSQPDASMPECTAGAEGSALARKPQKHRASLHALHAQCSLTTDAAGDEKALGSNSRSAYQLRADDSVQTLCTTSLECLSSARVSAESAPARCCSPHRSGAQAWLSSDGSEAAGSAGSATGWLRASHTDATASVGHLSPVPEGSSGACSPQLCASPDKPQTPTKGQAQQPARAMMQARASGMAPSPGEVLQPAQRRVAMPLASVTGLQQPASNLHGQEPKATGQRSRHRRAHFSTSNDGPAREHKQPPDAAAKAQRSKSSSARPAAADAPGQPWATASERPGRTDRRMSLQVQSARAVPGVPSYMRPTASQLAQRPGTAPDCTSRSQSRTRATAAEEPAQRPSTAVQHGIGNAAPWPAADAGMSWPTADDGLGRRFSLPARKVSELYGTHATPSKENAPKKTPRAKGGQLLGEHAPGSATKVHNGSRAARRMAPFKAGKAPTNALGETRWDADAPEGLTKADSMVSDSSAKSASEARPTLPPVPRFDGAQAIARSMR